MFMKFSEKVYAVCKNIPKGKVTTYKNIAEFLGTKAYRAVGLALNRNPYKEVPCHRIISSSGHLHGFAHGLKRKRQLLEREGVEIKNDRIDLEKFGFRF